MRALVCFLLMMSFLYNNILLQRTATILLEYHPQAKELASILLVHYAPRTFVWVPAHKWRLPGAENMFVQQPMKPSNQNLNSVVSISIVVREKAIFILTDFLELLPQTMHNSNPELDVVSCLQFR